MFQLHLSDQHFHCLLRCGLCKRFEGKWFFSLCLITFTGRDRCEMGLAIYILTRLGERKFLFFTSNILYSVQIHLKMGQEPDCYKSSILFSIMPWWHEGPAHHETRQYEDSVIMTSIHVRGKRITGPLWVESPTHLWMPPHKGYSRALIFWLPEQVIKPTF